MRGRNCLTALAGVLMAGPAMAAELTVMAVNGPLGVFAKTLGGDKVAVSMPAPADEDPAFWQPGPQEIAKFQAADLILLNGAKYARWRETASLPRARLVDTSKAFADRLIEEKDAVSHSHGGETHSHGELAFTTWIDFGQAAQQAEAVANALIAKLPEEQASIEGRLAELQSELESLSAEMAPLAGAALIASHPIYQYFARAYDVQIPAVVWEPDRVPSESELAALEALIAETGAEFMIWENEPIAEAASAVEALGLGNLIFRTGNAMQPDGDLLGLWRNDLSVILEAVAK